MSFVKSMDSFQNHGLMHGLTQMICSQQVPSDVSENTLSQWIEI